MPRNLRGIPVSRKRSCASCRAAKTRCSLSFPICMRCKSRQLSCEYGPQAQEMDVTSSDNCIGENSPYPNTDKQSEKAQLPSEDLQSVFTLADEQSSDLHQSSREHGINDDMSTEWTSERTTMSQSGPRVSGMNISADFAFEIEGGSQDPGSSILRRSGSPPTQLPSFHNPSDTFTVDLLPDLINDNGLAYSQIPSSITSTITTCWPKTPPDLPPQGHSNLPAPKTWGTVGSHLIAKHIMSLFRSYPRLLCRKNSLPPFIHPRYPDREPHERPSDIIPVELPESLSVCASLVHMYQGRTSGNSSFIWKTIASEQQRLYDEFNGYEKWKLLSALQAVTIYLIMQISENQQDSEIAFKLVVTMGELAAKLFAENGYYCLSELKGNFPDWDEWVFAESLRRTMILLFIMEKLHNVNIDLTPPAACTGFDSVPLPCSDELWRADTRISWETSYKKYLLGRKGNGHLKYGTLRQSQQMKTGIVDNACLEDLETWCTGIDSFGTVVIMVASGM